MKPMNANAIPTSLKKFRQSPEVQGFYAFVYDNNLQKESFDILNQIMQQRKEKAIAKTDS